MAFDTFTGDSCFRRDPLHVVADKILEYWKKSDDHRTDAALLLKEAKERVECGEDKRFPTFKAWRRELPPGRSDRDIRRLLQRANAPDPAAEGERQRRIARESMERTRARRKGDQRWTAASSDDVVRTGAGDLDCGSIEPTDDSLQPIGDYIETDFEQELERCVDFVERNGDRVARLQRQYRIALLRRLQEALSPFADD